MTELQYNTWPHILFSHLISAVLSSCNPVCRWFLPSGSVTYTTIIKPYRVCRMWFAYDIWLPKCWRQGSHPEKHMLGTDGIIDLINVFMLINSVLSTREKLKLVWKSKTRSVHVFMETLPPRTWDQYSAFCHVLWDEYTLYTDPASATLSALAIRQEKHESPK